MNYKIRIRSFEAASIETILTSTLERYIDVQSGRFIAIGSIGNTLVTIPYELDQDTITPVTIHACSRKQINFRLKVGRYQNVYET